jgi:hypothetical protein
MKMDRERRKKKLKNRDKTVGLQQGGGETSEKHT